MTIKEQAILKALVSSLKFNDFKPKLTITDMHQHVMGMESYKVIVSDENKSNKSKPVIYFLTVSYYNESVPEATDLWLYNILFN